MRRLVLLFAGVLALAACGTDAASDGPDVTGEWQLASGAALGADLPFPPGTTATLALSGGEANGTAFCNRFFASYEFDGSSFSFGDIGSTEMGCEPDMMAAESTYLASLDSVDTAVLDGADLLLTGAGVELRFSRVVAVPDSPLAGTRWVLDTLVDGETASSVLGDAQLELATDGTLSASTGCRTIGGAWSSDGETLVVDAAYDTFGCPPPADRQDVHVLGVLAARPVATVDGDRLTLTSPDGRGLGYRAAS
jgi:heat shock protein HslJ